MDIKLYNPFEKFDFSAQSCFLTGQDVHSNEEIHVFPEWILDRYSLRGKTFKMLEGSSLQYQDMKMPCHPGVIKNAINPLEQEIEAAFTEGYEAVLNLPEERLFQWMAKLFYGVLYQDISIEVRKSTAKGKEFELNGLLNERLKKLHLLLQSLVVPMEFNGSKLWSIRVFEINYSKDVFNYRDELTNLNFSLGMNGFGIVACLQDNGAVGINQQEITDLFVKKTLHPIQFEELCARFIYANYLLNHFAKYTLRSINGKVIVESAALVGSANKYLF
ncbi:MAG: hypothetical protein OSA04_05740, partial [Flavobacteriales bacterium]|nr:hypothetical protein [Flavobacteriales bacterium]